MIKFILATIISTITALVSLVLGWAMLIGVIAKFVPADAASNPASVRFIAGYVIVFCLCAGYLHGRMLQTEPPSTEEEPAPPSAFSLPGIFIGWVAAAVVIVILLQHGDCNWSTRCTAFVLGASIFATLGAWLSTLRRKPIVL